MSGDAGIPNEQGVTSEVRYQEISNRLKQWLTDHSQEGERSQEWLTKSHSTKFGVWKGPSGKEYTINSSEFNSGTTMINIETQLEDGKVERFDYDSGEQNTLLYYKAVRIPPSDNPFDRMYARSDYQFYEAGYYSTLSIDHNARLLNFPGYGMVFRNVLKNEDVKKVDVLDVFGGLIADLEHATQVQKPNET